MADVRPLRAVALAIMVAGILGNVLTIAVYLRSRSLRKPINFFLVALAFSDITMLATVAGGPYIREWTESQAVCTAMGTVIFMQFVFSVNFFTATAVLRYISILQPSLSKRILTWRMCAVVFILMWIENLLIM